MDNQSARAVLMVRPGRFASNPETLATNRFQRPAEPGVDSAARARAEFDALAAALTRRGVDVHVLAGRTDIAAPDEVFPNNWLSLHADGTAVLYPLMAPTRRAERRQDVLATLRETLGYRIDRTIDLTPLEAESKYLEGTGSLVLDHLTRTVYASLSARTHPDAVAAFAAALGYTPLVFDASGRDGLPVYHTNVLLSIGTGFALFCAAAVRSRPVREGVVHALAASGREVIELGLEQMEAFACNALELRGKDGPLIALSARALAALDARSRRKLQAHGELVAVDVGTIESCGGGSVRCMLAEVFLPVARAGRVPV
jgi:hypothetical protein